MYRKIYFEIFHQVLESLKSRFETDSSHFLKSLEAFTIGNASDGDKIITFYNGDFDKDRLVSDRDMFLELTSRSNKPVRNLKDAVEFSRGNECTFGVLPEYVKFIRLMRTVPGSTCTHERSFSALRRLKNYLRTTLLQDRLNNIAVLHIYHDVVDKLDNEELMDKFITRNAKLSVVFALRQK
ncbi:uncharacterized protein LOC117182668 [Belonocnema kinseyi]|uniref:uncharacterized protein LOC117182668 n=1 Tax=Belonocnema kinseyi TaxID=2817044 RepID=UPI00143D8180|nr:uncharacterized protein LOC117182668 [Belonocnema kinseyi]